MSESRCRAPAERRSILVVEDDRAHATALRLAMETRGFHAALAASGSQAMQAVETGRFDAILLDLGLPDIDGIQLCSMLRVWARCPILVVTADHDDARLIAALDSGADDYVVKPYNMAVLDARVRVAMRHSAVLAATVEEELLACGDVQVDVAAHRARIGEADVELQPRQFTLLVTLLRNAGRMVPHGHLARVLWGEPGPSDIERLRAAISALRRRLGDGPQRPSIETETTLGYRLAPPT